MKGRNSVRRLDLISVRFATKGGVNERRKWRVCISKCLTIVEIVAQTL